MFPSQLVTPPSAGVDTQIGRLSRAGVHTAPGVLQFFFFISPDLKYDLGNLQNEAVKTMQN